MMELVQEVCWCLIVTHLDSWRCTFSMYCISFVVYGPPNSSGILEDWAVKDSISCFFDFLVSDV